MKYLYSFFLLLMPVMVLCQQNLTNRFKIYSTSTQKQVSLDEIVARIANADVLFFGEEHNDSTGHVLEYILFKKLAEKYPGQTALSMEMFETDCQTVLNEYLAGLIREKNFITEGRAWHNYKDYRPLIEFAREEHIPVIAANAPARYTNMVNRLGLVSLNRLDWIGKSWLPPMPLDTATGLYYNKFLEIMGGHSAMGGMQMYQAQNLWDATMGWSIAKFYRSHPNFKILQINGGFHSDEKLGNAAMLKKYAPKVRIVNIALVSDDNFNNPDWSKLNNNNDFIILTDPTLPKTF